MKSLSVWKRIPVVLVYACLIAVPRVAIAEEFVGKGEWQSRSGGAMRGTWTATLFRSGAEMEGTISLTGSPLFVGGDITGTIERDEFVLGILTEGDHIATFKGTLTDDKIAGEWDCPAISDQGVWSGTLRPEERQ